MTSLTAAAAPTEVPAIPPRRKRSAILLVLLGLAAMQAAWICVVAPFGGVDEIDHAYRADAVAHGDVLPDYVLGPAGRGELLGVRGSLVDAARDRCDELALPAPDKCHPVERLDDGRVLVASSAARYNPVFYAVIGTAALPFEGTTALYVMRTTTAATCLLLLTWALVVSAGRRTRWPTIAAVLATTPMVTYSASMAAPNGVELCAAVLAWAGGISVVSSLKEGGTPQLSARAALIVGLVVVGGTRTMGPLWVLAIGAALLALAPLRAWVEALRARPRGWAASIILVGAASVSGAVWTWASGASRPTLEGLDFTGSPYPGIFVQPVVWVLQSIGVFPTRNDFAPWPVYALVVSVWGAVLVTGLRAGHRRERLVVLALVVGTIAFPVALTLLTYADLGFAWQGRYTWPVACGVLFVLAEACRRDPGSPDRVLLSAVLIVGGAAHVLSQWSVATEQPAGLGPLAVALSPVGFALVLAGLRLGRPGQVTA